MPRSNRNQSGAVLVTILAVMILASLGLGLALMFHSSTRQSVETNMGLRARTLAEAGFRYAGGVYKNAGNLSSKVARLQSMDQEEVTLRDNNGSFQLSIFPYWFLASTDVTNADTLTLEAPGKFPDGFQGALPDSGTLMINDEFYAYTSGTATKGAAAFDPDRFSLRISDGKQVTMDKNTNVYLAFPPPSPATVDQGGSLVLFSDQTRLDLLPQRNGFIDLWADEVTFSGAFRYRDISVLNDDSVRLNGITLEEDGSFPVNLGSDSRIVLKKQMFLCSRGNAGGGSVQSLQDLDLNVYLTNEAFSPPDNAETLDLGGPGEHKPDIFTDKGTTKLENWEFENPEGLGESELITTSTQEVSTVFDDPKNPDQRSNFLTFQNFSEVEQDKGYTMELVDKDRIPASARTKNLNGIWGNASDNIYFVGEDGTILHFNGETIEHSNINFDIGHNSLNAIWGLPKDKFGANANVTDKIFVVGDNGTTLINEGSGWEKSHHKETYHLYAAHGTGWGHFDGYGQAGSNPYNWDSPNSAGELKNYQWYLDTFNGSMNFRCLWATNHTFNSYTDYGAGTAYGIGQILPYQNIMVGEFVEYGTYHNYPWKDGIDKDFGYEPGDGIIMHEFYTPPVFIPDVPLRGIWGSSWNNVYVVGGKGKIYRSQAGSAPDYGNKTNATMDWNTSWQGGWKKINDANIPNVNLNGVYGNSADDFYVIGDNGTILYNKGNGFEQVPTNGVTSENLNSIWGSDTTGIYAVGNNGTIVFLGYPTNKIGGHILPLKKNAEIADKWRRTQKFLNYRIQVKTVWGEDLDYGASGICFRWHEEEPGKYAGYGLSFLRHDPSNDASMANGSNYNDMIPDGIKPYFRGIKENNNTLLLVLWEQYVQGGAEHRRWIAYKNLRGDNKTHRDHKNGPPVDLASLVVKVHEKSIEGKKINDINVYYGNARDKASQTSDKLYNNKLRNRYNASFGRRKDKIQWPSDIDTWSHCTSNCQDIDRFTLVDNVSVDAVPIPATPALKYWIVNPAADSVILRNGFTIRAGRFTSPSGNSFGNQSQRSEIGLHVFGDIGDHGSQRLISFTDFAVQLGVDADGEDTQSSFGNLK